MPDAPLRKLLVDINGRCGWTDTHLAGNHTGGSGKRWPRDALVHLLKIVWIPGVERLSQSDVMTMDRCQYHVHESGVRCKKGNYMEKN